MEWEWIGAPVDAASTLLYLLLDLSGVRNTEADHAAAHLGKAIGGTGVARYL